jgi:thioredoxin:protein disulfide reductase
MHTATLIKVNRRGLFRTLCLFVLYLFSVIGFESGAGLAKASVLPPEQAFPFETEFQAPDRLLIHYTPKAGYYLYRERFQLEALEGIQLEAVHFPEGEKIQDEFFGPMEIYRGPLSVLALIAPKPGSSTAALLLTTQGCAEKAGVCYPPQSTRLEIDWARQTVSGPETQGGTSRFLSGLSERLTGTFLSEKPALGPESAVPASDRVPPSLSPPVTDTPPSTTDATGAIATLLQDASTLWILLSFFGFGLLLSLTPCTFPMIPILSGIILGQGPGLSRARGFGLSLAYVFGMASSYAAAGLLAGVTGTFLAAALQNAWVLGSFGLLFVVLALAMFGFFTLQLPSSLQTRLSEGSGRFMGKGFGGLWLMGVVSALIIGPCMAAPLAGALLYIAQTGNASLGAAALFAMGIGMGVPLLAVGIAAQTLLPRIGPWMEGVKKAFGVILLGMALWFVSPVVPEWFVMLGWGLLGIFSGLYLRAIESLPHNASSWKRFWKGLGVVLLMWGLAILAGLAAGGRDPLQPLVPFQGAGAEGGSSPATRNTAVFVNVDSLASFESALQNAQGRPVMLVFSADWCVSCRQMERGTLRDRRVLEQLGRMHLIKADVTQNTPNHHALLRQFGLFGPPGFVFFNAKGEVLPELRQVGYVAPDDFLRILAAAQSG